MKFFEITNFEQVLSKQILKNKNVMKIETNRITGPGENYGSSIISVTITLQDAETGKEEKTHMVAKLPPTNEFIKHFMNSSVTFRHELGFYQTILPCLQHFYKERNLINSLNFFPDFYGGRLSLDPSESLDANATILLENLKESGFTIADRSIGFDLEATKLILAKMAQFHGVCLALKIIKPEVFEKKIAAYLDEFRVFFADDNPEALQFDVIMNIVLDANKDDEVCALHLDQIRTALEKSRKSMLLWRNSPELSQGKFATLIHNDLWVNNIMVKEHLNKIQDVKFIDWQLYEHGSLARDVLFTIFTSVKADVLTEYLDELILFYYEELSKHLEKLKCENHFSFVDFQTELKYVVGNVSLFRLFMPFPVIFDNGKLVNSEDLNKERIFEQMQVSELCKDRIRLATRQIIRKGWL